MGKLHLLPGTTSSSAQSVPGTQLFKTGMIFGVKSFESFVPATFIALD